MIRLLGGHRRKAVSLTQAEKKEEKKKEVKWKGGMKEKDKQGGERRKAREDKKGFPFTSPLAGVW